MGVVNCEVVDKLQAVLAIERIERLYRLPLVVRGGGGADVENAVALVLVDLG